MFQRSAIALAATLTALVLAAPVAAQRGTGAEEGVARDRTNYYPQPMTGTVIETVVTECPQTTGRYDTGVHMLADTMGGQRTEIHLGPEPEIRDLMAALEPGAAFRAEVFRTDAMPVATFVAVIVAVDGETFQLRDPDTLRPSWAVGRGAGAGAVGRMPQGGCWWAVPPLE